ncbi:hypothetical protein C0J52_04684 [Blattella germanica]|nr:hypothetical protein C0J52_04684 [Blattella germanica]
MEYSRPAKRVLLNNSGQRYRGRPRARWEDNVEEDARRIGVLALAKQKTKKIGENSLGQPGPSMGCRADDGDDSTYCLCVYS